MNKVFKQLVAIAVVVVFFAGSAVAQEDHPGTVPAAQPAAPAACPLSAGVLDFAPTQVCYIPGTAAFVVIDSVDCAVDLLVREADSMRRVGRYTTDDYKGRHDLKNIVRPKSIAVVGGNIVVLASSMVDSSFISVLGMTPNGEGELEALGTAGFQTSAYAFDVNRKDGEIIVVGKSPVGYDIHVLDVRNGVEQMSETSKFHYHLPMQSERILASDPHGYGLAIVAILVVFVALVSITLLMSLFSSIVRKSTEKKSGVAAGSKSPSLGAIASGVDGEVYAAIAAAIYAYNQDLHDEENAIITIQKVDRAWTPWNAKFYNMNRYFLNNKR